MAYLTVAEAEEASRRWGQREREQRAWEQQR